MSLNPEVPYVYNPAYHIKRGWRLQVIDTALVTDFVAFRPGLTTTEQPNSDHTGTREWVYITAAAIIPIGECVSRAAGSAAYDACLSTPATAFTAAIVGVADKAFAVGDSGWIVKKGTVNAEVLVGYGADECLIFSGTIGHLTAGAVAEVGIGIGLGAAVGGTASVYIDCK